MKKEFTEGYHDVYYQPGSAPVFCYRSGLTVYEETFSGGTLNASGWNAAGYPLNVLTNFPSRLNPDLFIHPNSFRLEIDGEYCDRELTFLSFDKRVEEGNTHAVITLRCARKAILIRIHTLLDGSPILTRWLELTNESEKAVAVSALSVIGGGIESTPLSLQREGDPDRVYSLGYMDADMHCTEGDFSWHPLTPDEHSFGGDFTRSRFRYPMFMLRNNLLGTILTAQLAWSAGYRFGFDYNAHREKGETALSFHMELDSFKPLNLLRAGETMVSPQVHIGMVAGDLDDAVNAMNLHLRRSVFTMQEADARQCLIGSGMGPEHDMNCDTTKQFIDQMAAAGAEVFIVDAGWYCPPGKENEWWGRVGSWNCNPDRYPNGIEEIRDYCHEKGLKFGMWMEPARASADALRGEHPDWFPTYPNGSRASFFLDYSNPEAVAWAEEQIAHVITDYRLDLFRIDYNVDARDVFHVRTEEGRAECRAFRHVQGYLAMYRRLKKRFPQVIFENCAGGGGRCDVGFISSFHHTWVSDNQTAPRSLLITNGMTMVIPPERVDRLVAGMGCHKRASLDFHMRNAMFGHMTLNVFGPKTAAMNPDVFEFIRHSTDLYKRFLRPYLPQALMYHHTPDTKEAIRSGFTVLEAAAPDASRSCIGVFTLTAPQGESLTVRPRGLSAAKRYRVCFDNSRTCCEMSGIELMNVGLTVRIPSALSSELLTFEEL